MFGAVGFRAVEKIVRHYASERKTLESLYLQIAYLLARPLTKEE